LKVQTNGIVKNNTAMMNPKTNRSDGSKDCFRIIMALYIL